MLHRPIVPGEHLRTWVDGFGAGPAGRNFWATLRYATFDASDHLVAEQWWTAVYLGTTCEESGEPTPDHTFASEAGERPIGTFTVEIDSAMARRYAEVSGDWSAHHFDVDAAQRSGVDRIFYTACARWHCALRP